MEKVRIDFFDVLGYLIPGSALLMVLWIAGDSKVISVWQVYESVHNLDKKAILVALFLAYIAGFILHALGNFIYDIFRYKKIKKYTLDNVKDDWALIRQYGEKHISILERWYALRALSQNLSAVNLICGLVCIAKWYQYRYYEWLYALVASIALCIILLKRAEVFHSYLNGDIAAILKLDLNKR